MLAKTMYKSEDSTESGATQLLCRNAECMQAKRHEMLSIADFQTLCLNLLLRYRRLHQDQQQAFRS